MKFNRSSGVILHPTSFPGPDGMGDLGPEAFRWIDFLKESGCELWQVLPLGPTGYGDSPYQCFSAFAGNPYLISSTELLIEQLLTRADLLDRPDFPSGNISFGDAITWKLTLLDRAYARFQKLRKQSLRDEFSNFQAAQASWLDDFALFMAIKENLGGGSWTQWPIELRQRDPSALQDFINSNTSSITRHKFRQFLFFKQWNAVHAYAGEKGIKIVGDVPIFVAYDSADAWSHPELFYVNKKGLPSVIAGVPPDYFSPTGQLWGNPLYRWLDHKKTNYAWWVSRLRSALSLFDIIRLDHFRGFAGYWEVKAGAPTAQNGRWVKGPGKHFFDSIQQQLGELPIIAEDLGEITPDVFELRDRYNFPGMKVMHFAFGSTPKDPFLPHNFPVNCVAYTGTHDNNTTVGWYTTASEKERDLVRRYLARDGSDIAWDMIRLVWSSVASITITPMQDLLSLGEEARMNFPGKASGNWSWRMPSDALSPALISRLKETNFIFNRMAEA